MKLEKNVILITGGSNGIGLALAERFLKNNNEVIICGRREEKLAAAKEKFPGLHIKCCDVGNEQERIDLRNWTLKNFPGLNILVNNAGIQNTLNLKDEGFDWKAFSQEIEINLAAPIHLSFDMKHQHSRDS